MDAKSTQIHPYDDIIDLPRPSDPKHPRMPRTARAAQFSPFSALSGYGEAIAETVRQTDACPQLNEFHMAQLNDALQQLSDAIMQQPEVTFTVFVADTKKAGGSYHKQTGKVRRVDLAARQIILLDGTRIPMDHICEMESALFRPFDDWSMT